MNIESLINIDNNFLIKDNLSKDVLKKSISFIANQKGVKINKIEKAYKKKIFQKLKLPPKISFDEIHIIIKTNFNHDLKFIDFNKSLIFYEEKSNSGLTLKKINKYNLINIDFFPPTNHENGLISQKLAKGIFNRPKNLLQFDSDILKNISEVISVLSTLNNAKIKISNHIKNFKYSRKEDPLNYKIIKKMHSSLNKYEEENIQTALTHGDFKCEHLYSLNTQLEYVIDWENVGIRSVFFDLLNFFVPWFAKRSYNYTDIKNYILQFVKSYLPQFRKVLIGKYDLYFSVFALERYARMYNGRSSKFNLNSARKRYYSLFKDL
ncbi:phosphotransferase [Candidatus Pelagibacter sp.]|nr:phosphotransferase [Candidatus Pelagibacter sp.]